MKKLPILLGLVLICLFELSFASAYYYGTHYGSYGYPAYGYGGCSRCNSFNNYGYYSGAAYGWRPSEYNSYGTTNPYDRYYGNDVYWYQNYWNNEGSYYGGSFASPYYYN